VRAFPCPVCRRLVTFESDVCLHCGTQLAFAWPERDVVPVDVAAHRCANREIANCNWLAPEEGLLCASCVLTRTRPADEDEAGMAGFAKAEAAKRRLLFELGELGLPIGDDLRFELLSSTWAPVTTGHADGTITLDLAEADAAQREERRLRLGEPYRTVLGTLRHEIGHYLQDVLAPEGSAERDFCRELFGDDRDDYQAAIDRHYAEGAPGDWPERFVSSYATMHPWEDWAETFAHYLHIRETLQTAGAYGVVVEGPSIELADPAPLHAEPAEATQDDDDIRTLLNAWLPLTYALNAINRSMGAPDLYPFVLGPVVARKLGFVHDLVRVRART